MINYKKSEAWEKIKIGHGYNPDDLKELTEIELKEIYDFGYVSNFHYHRELMNRS